MKYSKDFLMLLLLLSISHLFTSINVYGETRRQTSDRDYRIQTNSFWTESDYRNFLDRNRAVNKLSGSEIHLSSPWYPTKEEEYKLKAKNDLKRILNNLGYKDPYRIIDFYETEEKSVCVKINRDTLIESRYNSKKLKYSYHFEDFFMSYISGETVSTFTTYADSFSLESTKGNSYSSSSGSDSDSDSSISFAFTDSFQKNEFKFEGYDEVEEYFLEDGLICEKYENYFRLNLSFELDYKKISSKGISYIYSNIKTNREDEIDKLIDSVYSSVIRVLERQVIGNHKSIYVPLKEIEFLVRNKVMLGLFIDAPTERVDLEDAIKILKEFSRVLKKEIVKLKDEIYFYVIDPAVENQNSYLIQKYKLLINLINSLPSKELSVVAANEKVDILKSSELKIIDFDSYQPLRFNLYLEQDLDTLISNNDNFIASALKEDEDLILRTLKKVNTLRSRMVKDYRVIEDNIEAHLKEGPAVVYDSGWDGLYISARNILGGKHSGEFDLVLCNTDICNGAPLKGPEKGFKVYKNDVGDHGPLGFSEIANALQQMIQVQKNRSDLLLRRINISYKCNFIKATYYGGGTCQPLEFYVRPEYVNLETWDKQFKNKRRK